MSKTFKKGMLLLAATALAASLAAGCAKETDSDGKSGSNGDGGAAPTANKEASAKPKAPVELSLMCFDCDKIAKSEDGPVYKVLQEKLGIKLKVLSSPYNNYNDKLNVMIASGELADLFFGDGIGKMEQYQTWIKEGFLLPISDESAKYPNLDKALKRFDLYKSATGGKQYGLPVSSYFGVDNPVYNDHVMYIRKDWLDKLGLKVPSTIDEFYEVAKAFAEKDPDGNNKADTYGYSSADGGLWWHYPIFNAFGTSTDRYRKTGDKWVPEIVQDETKSAVAFLKKMYDEKIMDPEFMINNGDQLVEKFVSGKVGIIFKNGGVFYNTIYDKFQKAYAGKDPKSLFTFGGIMTGKDGKQRLDGFGNSWLFSFINNKSSEEKKTKALELLDFLASDEGITLMRWGIEGTHYKKEGDKFVNLLGNGENGKQQTIVDVDGTARLKTLVTWDSGFISDSTPNKEEVMSAGKEGIRQSNADPLFGMFIDPNVLPPELGKTTGDYAQETIVKLIAKSKSFDSDWDNFVKTWLSKGGQKIWDETNKMALEQNR